MAVLNIATGSTLAANDFSAARNDRGVVKYGGTVAGSRFSSQGVGQGQVVTNGSVIASGTDLLPINEAAWLAGRLAKTVEGEYVIMGITNTLAGQTNTALGSPGQGTNVDAIHENNTIRTTLVAKAIRQGKYDSYSGQFDNGYPETDASGVHDLTTNTPATATSDEAVGGGFGSSQGEFSFQYGSNIPSNADYGIKNS